MTATTPGPSPHHELERVFARYRDRGDLAAIAEVYDRTSVRLLSVASHLCGEPADAEDAVQATFLTALESAEQWQPHRPLMPWLLGILSNRVRRQRRASGRRIDSERLPTALAPPADDAAEAIEFSRAVDEGIDRLPQTYQSVLVLRIKHGLSPADIAHALRRPPATVRAQLSRGMDMLRRSLPPVFAAGIAVAALPARGLDAVRTVILARAAERIPTAPAASPAPTEVSGAPPRVAPAPVALSQASAWIGAALVLAAVASIALLLAPATKAEPPSARSLPPSAAASDALAAGAERGAGRADEPLPTNPGLERTAAAGEARGQLRVALRRDGAPATRTLVRLEALGARPDVWITNVSDRWGSRDILEPIERADAPVPVKASTDEFGVATFEGLEQGYWLVHAPGRTSKAHVTAAQPADLAVDLDDHTVAIHGAVSDGQGAAIAGATVWASARPDGVTCQPTTVTDGNGRFVAYVPRGVHLAVSASGFRPTGLLARRGTPETAPLDVHLEPGGGNLRGQVVDPSGRPVAHCWVQVGAAFDTAPGENATRIARSAVPMRIRTDEAGGFVFLGVHPGTATVTVEAPGFAPASRTACVDPSAEPWLPIALHPGATVHGTVRDPHGAPMAHTRVRLVRGSSAFDDLVTSTDEAGRFELGGVPAGPAWLVAGAAQDGWAQSVLDVAGDRVRWDPSLAADGLRIAGRVLGSAEALAAGLVVVRDDSRDRDVARVGLDGAFEFEVPEFELRRRSTLLVYRAADVDAEARTRTFSLGQWVGARFGDTQLEIDTTAPSRCGSLAGFVPHRPGARPMTLSVCRDAPEDRVFVAATPAPDETYAGFTLDDIPAGRYWIRAGEAKLGPFQVSPGLCLDLGNLDRHRQPLGERPTVRRALAFVPDRGATGFGQLIVTVRTARGALLGSHSIRHVHGAWRLALELPLGEYQVSARAASGHFADYRLNIEDLELRAYAEQVQISR